MSFLNPLLLWGALGAGIPLVIHLWGRRRPRRVLFPSLRLIRAAQTEQPSLSRLRDLLVLLLRMLLIVLVSLALARPMVASRALARLSPPGQRAVMLIDASASMACRCDKETSLHRAKRAARVICKHLPRTFEPLLFALTSELAPLRDADALDRLRVSDGRTQVLRVLDHTEQPPVFDPDSRVFVITDLQESSFRGELHTALPQPPIIVDVGNKRAWNHAITGAVTRTVCPMRGRPLEVEARLETSAAHHGEGDVGPDVLEVGAELQGESIPGRTAPGGRGRHSAHLRATPREAGDLVLSLALPEDDLPSDDLYHHVVRARDDLRVTVLTGDSDAKLIALALNPGGDADTGIDVSQLAWDDAPGEFGDADVVVMADAPAAAPAMRAAGDFARAGGGVILFSGPETQVAEATLRDLLGAPVKLGETVAAPRDEPFTLSEINTLRPPLAAFADPRAGRLLDLRFTHRRAIANADSARVLARFSDGGPAILGTLNPDRRFVLLNTTLDDRWTNAPFHPAYVPLIHRLCYDVAGAPTRVWPDWRVGQPMRVPMPEGARGEATIRGPGGQELRAEACDRRWLFTPPERGVYEATWAEGGSKARGQFAANVHPAESDFARIAPEELRRRFRAKDAVLLEPGALVNYLAEAALIRVDLAYPLLLLALLLLVAETFLTGARGERPGLVGGASSRPGPQPTAGSRGTPRPPGE